MTSNVNFKPDFSFGNLITIGMLVVSIAGGWALLSTTVKANTARIERIEAQQEAQRTTSSQVQLEVVKALTELQTDVRYLRQAVDAFTKQNVDRQ